MRQAWAAGVRAGALSPVQAWAMAAQIQGSPVDGGRRAMSTAGGGGLAGAEGLFERGKKRRRSPPTPHRKGAHLRGKDADKGPPGRVYATPSTRRHVGDAKGTGTGLFVSLGNRGPGDAAGPLSKGSGFAGRGWSASELRLATTEDLHKLWYVLLKERNSLFAEQNLYKRADAIMLAPHRFDLVRKSMARIKHVIGERMYAEPDPVRRAHLKSFLA